MPRRNFIYGREQPPEVSGNIYTLYKEAEQVLLIIPGGFIGLFPDPV